MCKIAYCPEVLAGWRIHQKSEGFKKPHLFVTETMQWVDEYIGNKLFTNNKKSIRELKNVNKAKSRLYSLFPDYRDIKDIRFDYSTRKNTFYIIISFIPFLGRITISIKKFIFNKEWFT